MSRESRQRLREAQQRPGKTKLRQVFPLFAIAVKVTDQFMGEFHRQGLAQEFDMRGSVKKTIKWKKGQAPKVSDGWDSEKGGR